MSSSDSETTCESDDSKYNHVWGYVELERVSECELEDTVTDEHEQGPYAGEPLADKEWLGQYNQQNDEREQRDEELTSRLDGTTELRLWCKCGRCTLDYITNYKECLCCAEIDECLQSLNTKEVLEDVDIPPNCITLHPGFSQVCLQKWSLRSAAGKYKTKARRRYRQTGTEESFLRVVTYREFTQLVHGYLGRKRYPLPACAYHIIRTTFQVKEEEFTGFEEEEDQ